MNIFVLDPDINFSSRVNKNERIISVFLRERTEIRNFRCIECGRIVFQYSGHLDSIYDGAKIPERNAIDIMCHQCKLIYRISSI